MKAYNKVNITIYGLEGTGNGNLPSGQIRLRI